MLSDDKRDYVKKGFTMANQTTSYTRIIETNTGGFSVSDVFYCPKCGGAGEVRENYATYKCLKTCDLCLGTGFITRESILSLTNREKY